MIDEFLVSQITKIANARYYKNFPLAGEKWFKESDVKYICEAFYDLAVKIKEKDDRQASNKET